MSEDTEKKSFATRHAFFARAKLSGWGTALVVIKIAIAPVWMLMIIDQINTNPWLMPGIYIMTILVALGIFAWNMVYWAPTSTIRQYIQEKESGEMVLEDGPTFARRLDRVVRAYGDQYVSTASLAGDVFIAIFFTIFFSRNGLHTFQPLFGTPSGDFIALYVQMKVFQVLSLIMSGGVVLLAINPEPDFIYRYIMDVARGNPEPMASPDESGNGPQDVLLSGNISRPHKGHRGK
jgi:hypothetical protein